MNKTASLAKFIVREKAPASPPAPLSPANINHQAVISATWTFHCWGLRLARRPQLDVPQCAVGRFVPFQRRQAAVRGSRSLCGLLTPVSRSNVAGAGATAESSNRAPGLSSSTVSWKPCRLAIVSAMLRPSPCPANFRCARRDRIARISAHAPRAERRAGVAHPNERPLPGHATSTAPCRPRA